MRGALRELFGLKRRVKKCCMTCVNLAYLGCVQERMVASHGMKSFPKDADELRRRYVCSDWVKR